MQLSELNERGKKADAEHPEGESAVFKRGAIISVHGINTIGEWQDDLSLWVQEAGYFTARVGYEKIFFKAPLPSQRNEVVRRIGTTYERFRERGLPVSVIAHSYGSCALGYFLLRNPSAQLHGIVLYGSILSRKFPWAMCAEREQLRHVLLEIGTADWLPWMARLALPFFGQVGLGGACGFKSAPECVYTARYPGVRHSDLQTPAHFTRVWIPFISDGRDAILDDPLFKAAIKTPR